MKKPKWLPRLLDAFLNSVEWTSVGGSPDQVFTYRCKRIGTVWEITVSPWLQEIYCGRYDGAVRLPVYEIDLLTVAEELDTVKYIGFDTDRLEATVEGEIDNSAVQLTFRREPPQNGSVRKKVNTFTGEITKITPK